MPRVRAARRISQRLQRRRLTSQPSATNGLDRGRASNPEPGAARAPRRSLGEAASRDAPKSAGCARQPGPAAGEWEKSKYPTRSFLVAQTVLDWMPARASALTTRQAVQQAHSATHCSPRSRKLPAPCSGGAGWLRRARARSSGRSSARAPSPRGAKQGLGVGRLPVLYSALPLGGGSGAPRVRSLRTRNSLAQR